MHAAECSLVNGKPACSIPHVQPRVSRGIQVIPTPNEQKLSGVDDG